MPTSRTRRAAAAAVVTTAAAALMAGPLTSSASAATFFRTVGNGNGLMLSSSSPAGNSPVVFVPEFKEGAQFSGATVGDPNTPQQLRWAQVAINGGTSILHKPTNMCLDVERGAEGLQGDDAVGARVVLNPCDGTLSQRWKDLGAGQVNPHSFQNQWNQLILTNTGTSAVLERSNSRLSPAERSKRIQFFFLNFVETV